MHCYAKYLTIAVVVLMTVGALPSMALTTDSLEAAGLTLTGYLEVELQFIDGEQDDTSDVTIGTLEFGVEYELTDWVSFTMLFLYEDGFDGVEVDEAYATLGGSEAFPVLVTAGRLYLPLGAYSSTFCSGVFCTDPLTQSLSEAQEEVLQATYGVGSWAVTLGAANGDADTEDTIDLYYGVVELTPAEGLTFGVSYTSNLCDADELTDLLPEEGLDDDAAGLSLYAIYETGPLYAQVEYVAGLDEVAAADLDADEDGSGDEPKAFNAEFGYAVTERIQLGARYGSSDEFGDFPEEQYGVVGNYTLFEGAVLAFEYIHNEFSDGAEEDCFLTRVAIGF